MENILKLGLKYTRTQQQLIYLNQASQQGYLPRGIGDQMKFVSAIHDPMLQSMCQSIMYFAGPCILDVMKNH